jgi:hypothetical protein
MEKLQICRRIQENILNAAKTSIDRSAIITSIFDMVPDGPHLNPNASAIINRNITTLLSDDTSNNTVSLTVIYDTIKNTNHSHHYHRDTIRFNTSNSNNIKILFIF